MNLGLTALELARIQFAFTVSFHIIFPAISIGLASFLAVLEWRWLKTNDPVYRDLFKFWIKVFALSLTLSLKSFEYPMLLLFYIFEYLAIDM